MRHSITRTAAALALGAALAPMAAHAADLSLVDPKGDDKGPGGYTYPTSPEYRPGSFDIVAVEIADKGDDVEVTVEIAAKIEDPWNSGEWGGNGFSLQFAQVYLDIDHAAGSGHTDTLPGLNVRFDAAQAWDRVILLSPQGRTRLQAEVNAKAGALKDAVVIPRKTKAKGRKLSGTVAKKDLGGGDPATWGVQVLMQSNEGFPSGGDLLTRKVNEIGGPHRFGGGNDWDCDPHVLDLLAGDARGDAGEVVAQAKALDYACDPSGDTAKSRLAVVPMVVRAPK